MNAKASHHEADPQPPELKQGNYPTLKRVWKGWAIGIGIVLVVILVIAIIFYKTGY